MDVRHNLKPKYAENNRLVSVLLISFQTLSQPVLMFILLSVAFIVFPFLHA